jgi:hypothetical protein
MTKADYIEAIRYRWPRDRIRSEPSLETVALRNEAIHYFQNSAKLWAIRGNLFQFADFEDGYSLHESEHCYRTAIKLTPREKNRTKSLAISLMW